MRMLIMRARSFARETTRAEEGQRTDKHVEKGVLSTPPITIKGRYRSAITADHKHFHRQNSCRKSPCLVSEHQSIAMLDVGLSDRYPIALISGVLRKGGFAAMIS